ncbi:MAG TPA: sulfite exporter TauE/SafE family protein [Streptosporangiaceae bacterium]|nr:sulfite exporter TauE/SafE family protein [Streptosporangiaceae bacterium]
MHLDGYMILGSAIVGLLVGLTGAGGGALMTPMLILLFGVTPTSAISSDLVAAVLMRPFGAAMHMRKGTVNFRMVGWMVVGSVPMALVGSYLLHLLGGGAASDQTHVELALGVALLVGAGAMVLRYVLDRRAGHQRLATISDLAVKPLPTIAIGMVGGLIVGMTSVGSGSLMIVLLLFVYPLIGANQLVGTDLTQAVPLTAAAALGAVIWGQVVFGVTASIVIGSVPAVLVGSYFSSRAPDRYIRPIITFVIFASGLKYVGVPTTALGITLGAVAAAGLATWLVLARPWQPQPVAAPVVAGSVGAAGPAGAPGAAAVATGAPAPTLNGHAPTTVAAEDRSSP